MGRRACIKRDEYEARVPGMAAAEEACCSFSNAGKLVQHCPSCRGPANNFLAQNEFYVSYVNPANVQLRPAVSRVGAIRRTCVPHVIEGRNAKLTATPKQRPS